MATKFVSALTGPEMDQALIDMAYHNSEAYAVGTRNGVEVGSSDVTYHNNSKYYAEQVYGYTDRAEDAAARAEAAVPAGTAGAVFFDRAQSLTTAQQSQARANIMAGGSNPNLLDNAYFVGGGSQLGDGVFPINQRGQTSYTAQKSFDRWTVDGNVTVTLQSGNIRVQATAPYVGLYQAIPMSRLKNGETYTFSIILDGNMVTQTFVLNAYGNWNNIYYGDDWYIPYICANGVCQFKAVNSSSSFDHTIEAVKLEKGTVSTLANDVPPNFGKVLEKCKRYLQRVKQPQGYTASVGFGMVGAASNILRTTIPLSSPLRNAASITATATNTGQMFVWGNGSYYSVTGVTGKTVLNGNAIVDITVNGTLENYKTYNLILNNADAYIDLSAPL